jgi:hypothetical protein
MNIYVTLFYISIFLNFFLAKKRTLGIKISEIKSANNIDEKIKVLENGIYQIEPKIFRNFINKNIYLSSISPATKLLVDPDFYIYKTDTSYFIYQKCHFESGILLLKLFFPYKFNITSYLLKGNFNSKLEYRISPIFDIYTFFVLSIFILSFWLITYAPIPYFITFILGVLYFYYRVKNCKITKFIIESIEQLIEKENLVIIKKIDLTNFLFFPFLVT